MIKCAAVPAEAKKLEWLDEISRKLRPLKVRQLKKVREDKVKTLLMNEEKSDVVAEKVDFVEQTCDTLDGCIDDDSM